MICPKSNLKVCRLLRVGAGEAVGVRMLRSLSRGLCSGGRISIDRSKLFKNASVEYPKGAEGSLVSHLSQRIKFRSAMTVAEYMRECLANPQHGYYIKREVFGNKGDFTTAPEISQIFGETVAIWLLQLFARMGQLKRPSIFRLVEMGPGKGTLMRDILGTFKQLTPSMLPALQVDFMEVSPRLKAIQENTIASFKDDLYGVDWFENMLLLPEIEEAATIYIAQEFFDALAVHQFQRTEQGWCELMIDVDESKEAPFPFRYVLSRGGTAATKLYSKYFPSKDVDEIEISPDAISISEQLGRAVAESDGLGAALIIDYGRIGPIGASVRAIREHKIEPALAHPGDADLSVDVDFGLLRDTMMNVGNKQLTVHGPIPQRQFLDICGGRDRARSLATKLPKEKAEKAIQSYSRLTSPDQMGDVYKAMAVTHSKLPIPMAFST